MATQQAFKSAAQMSVALTTADTAVTTPATFPVTGDNILIYNATTATVACEFDTAQTAASTASAYIVPPGARMIVTVGPGYLFASAMMLSAGSGSVYFMRGDGSTY